MIDLSLGANVEDGNTDYTGGSYLVDTNAYAVKIKTAYLTYSKSKALAVNVVLDVDGTEVTDQQYITTGEAKGCKTTYSREVNGEVKHYPLPGYATIDQLCLLTVGEQLAEVAKNLEKKMINLYRDGAEKPTEVDVMVDLVGQEIIAGIQKQTVNKRDQQGNTLSDTKEINVVDKYFRVKDKGTVSEIKAQNESEGTFYATWVSKNEGKVIDKTDKDAVKSTASAGTTEKPKSLFK